jgi:hypothetical protein
MLPPEAKKLPGPGEVKFLDRRKKENTDRSFRHRLRGIILSRP